MKPNFIIIGAPKAATTSVGAILAEHPDVFMFPRKGTQFFDRHYDYGFDWYCSLFKDAGDAKAIGEGSASYSTGTSDSLVPGRIARHLPDAKLIYLVRDPLKRIESHYAQQIDNGLKFANLSEAVKTFPPLVEGSRYWSRLNDYRTHFPDDRILILFFEDFREDPARVMRRCYEFLEINPEYEPPRTETRKNTRADKRTDRALLRWVRKSPAFVKLQWAMPLWMTERLKRVLRKKIDVPIEWDDETRAQVLDRLRDEISPFLTHCGKPPDYWSIESSVLPIT